MHCPLVDIMNKQGWRFCGREFWDVGPLPQDCLPGMELWYYRPESNIVAHPLEIMFKLSRVTDKKPPYL